MFRSLDPWLQKDRANRPHQPSDECLILENNGTDAMVRRRTRPLHPVSIGTTTVDIRPGFP